MAWWKGKLAWKQIFVSIMKNWNDAFGFIPLSTENVFKKVHKVMLITANAIVKGVLKKDGES